MSAHLGHRLVRCRRCGEQKFHKGRGLCSPCYTLQWREDNRLYEGGGRPAPEPPPRPIPPRAVCAQCGTRPVGKAGQRCPVCAPEYSLCSEYDKSFSRWVREV